MFWRGGAPKFRKIRFKTGAEDMCLPPARSARAHPGAAPHQPLAADRAQQAHDLGPALFARAGDIVGVEQAEGLLLPTLRELRRLRVFQAERELDGLEHEGV